MMNVAAPAIYALFVWWFTTGLVLLLVLRQRRVVVASLAGAAILVPVSLYVLALSSASTSIAGAYVAFSAAILLWGTQEIGFLTGTITGPRRLSCPPGATGTARLRFAVEAILYHELALISAGVAVLAVTWHAPNQAGALTFLVLWTMRISAKLNLFLGVPVLNDELMPSPILYMRSYFLRGPVNAFFPVAIVLAVLGLSALVTAASDPDKTDAQTIGYTLVAALMGLAILEHVFMLVPAADRSTLALEHGKIARRTDNSLLRKATARRQRHREGRRHLALSGVRSISFQPQRKLSRGDGFGHFCDIEIRD